jgi:hypothetical protein
MKKNGSFIAAVAILCLSGCGREIHSSQRKTPHGRITCSSTENIGTESITFSNNGNQAAQATAPNVADPGRYRRQAPAKSPATLAQKMMKK